MCAAFRFRDYIMSSRVIQLFSNRCFILAANASDFASVGLSAYGYRDFDLEDVIHRALSRVPLRSERFPHTVWASLPSRLGGRLLGIGLWVQCAA